MFSPKWMLSHLGVLALVGAMIFAGFWQINRHQERGERNDIIRARSSEQVVALDVVATPDSDPEVGEAEQFRRVSVAGVYQVEDQVLVRNRTLEGSPGFWVLTPLLTDEGWAAVVNRGWVPLAWGDRANRNLFEAVGRIEVIGSIQPTREAEGLQRADPAAGVLTTLARPDIVRLAQQVDYPVVPVVVQLDPDGDLSPPVTLALPALDSGPHASYAVQWFVFTTIALIGYPLVLRRVARGEAESMPEDDADPGEDAKRNERRGSQALG